MIYESTGALTAMVNMETGLRGYYLTGKDEFLTPYNDGRVAFTANIAALKKLTSDNPAQTQRWNELETRAATWQREIVEPGLSIRRDINAQRVPIDAIVKFVSSGQGKAQTDAMRNIFAQAIGEEQSLLHNVTRRMISRRSV